MIIQLKTNPDTQYFVDFTYSNGARPNTFLTKATVTATSVLGTKSIASTVLTGYSCKAVRRAVALQQTLLRMPFDRKTRTQFWNQVWAIMRRPNGRTNSTLAIVVPSPKQVQ